MAVSKEAKMFNQLFAEGTKQNQKSPKSLEEERAENAARKKPELPEGVTCEDMEGIDAEIIRKAGGAHLDEVILYIHGGGFCTGDRSERREITYYLADQYERTVISINYRLAPENIWPAALDDCYDIYRELLNRGYHGRDMIFMGESAGGTLVLSLALKCRDDGIELPKAIAAYSPCTNQAEGFPSHRAKADTDYMLGDSVNTEKQKTAVFGPNHPDERMRDPYISPIYGDYAGMPPVFLAAADYEALCDDAVELFRKLVFERRPVGIDIQHGLFHAYPMFPVVPEARETIAKTFDFIDKFCGAD